MSWKWKGVKEFMWIFTDCPFKQTFVHLYKRVCLSISLWFTEVLIHDLLQCLMPSSSTRVANFLLFVYLLFQLHFFCCLRANLALSKEKHPLASFSQMLLQLHPRHLQKSKKSEYWPLDAPGTCSWVFEGSMDGSAGAPSYWEAVAHLKEWVKPFHDLKAISYSKEGILPEDGINTFGIQIFKKDHLCFSCRTYSFYYNSKNYVSFWKLFKRASNVFQSGSVAQFV